MTCCGSWSRYVPAARAELHLGLLSPSLPLSIRVFPSCHCLLMLFVLFAWGLYWSLTLISHPPFSCPAPAHSILIFASHPQDLELKLSDSELEGMIRDGSVSGNKWITEDEYVTILKHSSWI